jgi:hypothetical protein
MASYFIFHDLKFIINTVQVHTIFLSLLKKKRKSKILIQKCNFVMGIEQRRKRRTEKCLKVQLEKSLSWALSRSKRRVVHRKVKDRERRAGKGQEKK